MLTAVRRLLLPPPGRHPLVTALISEKTRGWHFALPESPAGAAILAAEPSEQRDIARSMIDYLAETKATSPYYHPYGTVYDALLTLLRRRLPFDHADVIALLDWSLRQAYTYYMAAPQILKVLEHYLADHPLTPDLQDRIAQLAACLRLQMRTADGRQWAARLTELAGLTEGTLPLTPGEAWSDQAIRDIGHSEAEVQLVWAALLNECLKTRGATPTAKWRKRATSLVQSLGVDVLRAALLRWFPLVDRPRTTPITTWPSWAPDPNPLLDDTHADILKGLVWLCADQDDLDLARALAALALSAYRRVPGVGPRCVRLGNACVWALGQMPGQAGVSQLARLRIKVRVSTAQHGIETALRGAASRLGLSPTTIEEMAVPAYGLTEVGQRVEEIGAYQAELVVTSGARAELRWCRADGKRLSSVPQAVKSEHRETLAELTQTLKDVRQMLPAQRDRIEALYLQPTTWTLGVWRERYLDHPLVGTLARCLIWNVQAGETRRSAIWRDGQLVGPDDHPLPPLPDNASVSLWHPIEAAAEEVQMWRAWLTEHQVRQPFKQAHREVYPLTDAERATQVYSNRFAAHILRQHQFNALCASRGWRNRLRLFVDDYYPPAWRPLSAWGLRAEFWIEGVGDDYGRDTTEAGTYLCLTTDQVRFYPLDSSQVMAHAGGGGYEMGGRAASGPDREPTPLVDIPPLVFSEIMRDVDLFVGVASIGADPHWLDGGRDVRHREYWAGYAFGDLSETARTRRQVLALILPRLKIAPRCALTDRFLVVRGDLRIYKIHLGSGNILMEPNDQYLCIVPARGASDDVGDKLWLPFEGDQTLAIILSKAMLLTQDKRITDPTITRQIKTS